MKKLKKIKGKIKLGYIIIACMFLFALLEGSFFGLIHNKKELNRLKKQNAALDGEAVRLGAELQRLESGDSDYLEEIARGKYHMSKPGETEFRFTPAK